MTAQIEKREIGNLVIEGIPEIPKKIDDKLLQYQNTREAAMVDWTSDGSSLVISTRFGEAHQFHLVEEAGGCRQQLTFFNEPVFSGVARPGNTSAFLFSKDIGGSELFQLYYFDMESGQIEMLTDGHSKNGNAVWNKSGTAFAYTSTRKNGIDHNLYIAGWEGGQLSETCILEAEGLWYPIDWSPDQNWLTVGQYLSISDCKLYRLRISDCKLFPLLDTENQVACRGGIWSRDGKQIFFTSDLHSDFRQLYLFDIESGTSRLVAPELPWNVEGVSMRADGKQLAFTLNTDAYSHLYLLDTESYEYRKLDEIPDGVIEGLRWHPKASKFAFSLNRPTAPCDVFVWDEEENQLSQWTFSEVGGLNPDAFVAPRLIQYDTFDTDLEEKRKIPAFYFKPDTATKKHPVLIYIHGGPESQYRPIFSPTFQYYLNELHIAVVAPNVRGSTGYGKNFLRLDNGYLREDSVKDIGMLLEWIAAQPELDSERIAVIGGSYGGYMVLASMTHFNDRLRCGVDIVGISNFITFLENTKSYRRALRRMEYGDERDPAMRKHLEKISPTTNAHKITKPLLIVQGMNDPRVPASEAEQMLKAIRKNGGEAWYLLAKDEGHGFRKKSNRDYYTKAVILFLQRYLMEK